MGYGSWSLLFVVGHDYCATIYLSVDMVAVTDHEDQLQFVKRHLYDMLVLVALGKYKVCCV